MDFHAKDEGQRALEASILEFDDELSDLILANSWPAISDAGNQISSAGRKSGVPCSELVHELKKALAPLGFHKTSLADHKVMFYRQTSAYAFHEFRQTGNLTRKMSQKISFTLEPLSVSFTGIDIRKSIDRDLILKTILHFYRRCSEFQYYLSTLKIVPMHLLTDLITTVKIENCSSLHSLDERFFTEFRSLNYLSVTDNSSLKSLPSICGAEKSPIEILVLDRNSKF